jgi:hypothetical protein
MCRAEWSSLLTAAIGFSDHSGWAVLAVVERMRNGFDLSFRRRVVTCPPGLPRQPFHAVAEQGAPRETVTHVRTAALALSKEAISAAAAEAGGLAAAAVAMGRTQIPDDIERVLASHALLHAAEGELYRDALSEAAGLSGLRVVRYMKKEIRSEAAAALGWPLTEIEHWLEETGKAAGTPWTKDEKDASAAALLALATVSSR